MNFFWGALAILAGMVISLYLGHLAVARMMKWLRRDLGEESTMPGEDLPAWIVGIVERSFFTLVVAAGLPSVLVAMMLWIGAKMAANWGSQDKEIQDIEALRITALLGSVVSMTFALTGGWIVRIGWLMIGW